MLIFQKQMYFVKKVTMESLVPLRLTSELENG